MAAPGPHPADPSVAPPSRLQARQVLVEAEAERRRALAAAGAAAEQLRAWAERGARALVARARRDAGSACQAAAAQRQGLRAEAEALAALGQRTAEELGRLHAPLGLIVVDHGGARDLGRTTRS